VTTRWRRVRTRRAPAEDVQDDLDGHADPVGDQECRLESAKIATALPEVLPVTIVDPSLVV
jgi:hypothetical protein